MVSFVRLKIRLSVHSIVFVIMFHVSGFKLKHMKFDSFIERSNYQVDS